LPAKPDSLSLWQISLFGYHVEARPLGRPVRDGVNAGSNYQSELIASNQNCSGILRQRIMTGLDLESFLLLLKADLGAWVILGLTTLGLAFLVWSSWRSRRALRNCLVVSLAAHLGFVLYGSTLPGFPWTFGSRRHDPEHDAHIRQIRVAPLVEQAAAPRDGVPTATLSATTDAARPKTLRWDLADAPLELADRSLQVSRPMPAIPAEAIGGSDQKSAPAAAVGNVTPEGPQLGGVGTHTEPRATAATKDRATPMPSAPLPPNVAEIDPPVDASAPVAATEKDPTKSEVAKLGSRIPELALRADRRLRPERLETIDPNRAGMTAILVPERAMPGRGSGDGRNRPTAAGSPAGSGSEGQLPSPLSLDRSSSLVGPIPPAQATPKPRPTVAGGTGLAALSDRHGGRTLADIPKFYQPRLDPDRSVRAQRIGASAASELAVERALDWLTRHQDDDGRWDGGLARYEDGTPVKGDDDFTVHCPAGETCFGECAYWEADTALTGLALLTYLGAGYTHTDSRYADAVGNGLDFLIGQQKPDGDLRGRSQVVGMYCHAMATLALCEAYALTGDDHLRDPVERAVAFLVRARAKDQMAWRYAPGAPVGDTSILGWVVMSLKSAKEVGIPIPGETSLRRGTLQWLDQVATGQDKGLARYQPWEPVTPTMTAEAWVCRQFLGVGGPGPASTEAAELLLHNESDRGPSNVYYWYYATLALYQHGGQPWSRWNAQMRDRIVGLQRTSGHMTGSWDPDGSQYGAKGGRIYCTALAALSLEVYYRYLRLYDEPKIPLEATATAPRQQGSRHPTVPTTATSNVEDR
jgi:hypothetical protein